MATFHLKLKERPFEAIRRGTKTVEARANKNDTADPNSENLMKEGDTIIFTKVDSSEQLQCKIERITLYPNVRALLESEGTRNVLSSGGTVEQGVQGIEAIGNYKELIEKNGVFAIKLHHPFILKEKD